MVAELVEADKRRFRVVKKGLSSFSSYCGVIAAVDAPSARPTAMTAEPASR
jgi:hypothetical protein